MIRTLPRVHGASALGARQPGDVGPVGPYSGRNEDDVQDDTVMTCRTEGGSS